MLIDDATGTITLVGRPRPVQVSFVDAPTDLDSQLPTTQASVLFEAEDLEDENDIDAQDDAAYLQELLDEALEVYEEVLFWHPHTLVDRNNVISEGRATVAYILESDYIMFGVAFCSLNDNFSRPVGRALAEQRLDLSPTVIPLARPVTQGEARKAIAALVSIGNLVGMPGYPTVSSIQIASW